MLIFYSCFFIVCCLGYLDAMRERVDILSFYQYLVPLYSVPRIGASWPFKRIVNLHEICSNLKYRSVRFYL